MKKVYVMNDLMTSPFNGIGVYINSLSYIFSKSGIEVGILSFYSDRDYFSIEKINGIYYYMFPKFEYPDRSLSRYSSFG